MKIYFCVMYYSFLIVKFLTTTRGLNGLMIKLKVQYSVLLNQLLISDCAFHDNKNMAIVKVESQDDVSWPYSNSISITNAIIINNKLTLGSSLFSLQHTYLNLSQVIVRNNSGGYAVFLLDNTIVLAVTRLEFAFNRLHHLMMMKGNTFVGRFDNIQCTIYNNSVQSLFTRNESDGKVAYSCIIQLLSSAGEALDQDLPEPDHPVYSITIANNTERYSLYRESELFNRKDAFNSKGCEVIPGSVKHTYLVDGIMFENNLNLKQHGICNCIDDVKAFCDRNELQARYPVQTVTSLFMIPGVQHNSTITLTVDHEDSTCQVLDQTEVYQQQSNNCGRFHYTITSENERECVLCLTETSLQMTDRFKSYFK